MTMKARQRLASDGQKLLRAAVVIITVALSVNYIIFFGSGYTLVDVCYLTPRDCNGRTDDNYFGIPTVSATAVFWPGYSVFVIGIVSFAALVLRAALLLNRALADRPWHRSCCPPSWRSAGLACAAVGCPCLALAGVLSQRVSYTGHYFVTTVGFFGAFGHFVCLTAAQRFRRGDKRTQRAGLLKRRLICAWVLWCVILLAVAIVLERLFAGDSLSFRFVFPVWELTAVAAYLIGLLLLSRDFGLHANAPGDNAGDMFGAQAGTEAAAAADPGI